MPQEPNGITLRRLDELLGQDRISLARLDELLATEPRAAGADPEITVGGTEPLASSWSRAQTPEQTDPARMLVAGGIKPPEQPQVPISQTLATEPPEDRISLTRLDELLTETPRAPGAAPEITVGGVEPVAPSWPPIAGPGLLGTGVEYPAEISIPGMEYEEDVIRSTKTGLLQTFAQAPGAAARAIGRLLRTGGPGAGGVAGQGIAGPSTAAPSTYEPMGANKVTEFLEREGGKLAEWATKEIREIPPLESPENAAQWVAQTLPQGIISTLPSLVGGAVGFAVGNVPGAMMGATLPAYGLNWNEARQTLQESGAEYTGLSEEEADGVAAMIAVPMAVLDAYMPSRVAGAWFGSVRKGIQQAVTARVLTELGRNATVEGLTEGLQNVVRQVATKATTGRPIDVDEIWQDVAAGGLVGGVVGGVVGAGAAPAIAAETDSRQAAGPSIGALLNTQAQLEMLEQAEAAAPVSQRAQDFIDMEAAADIEIPAPQSAYEPDIERVVLPAIEPPPTTRRGRVEPTVEPEAVEPAAPQTTDDLIESLTREPVEMPTPAEPVETAETVRPTEMPLTGEPSVEVAAEPEAAPIETVPVRMFKVGTRRESAFDGDVAVGSVVINKNPNEYGMLRVEQPDGSRVWLDAEDAKNLVLRGKIRRYTAPDPAEKARRAEVRKASLVTKYEQLSNDDLVDIVIRNEEQLDRENMRIAEGYKTRIYEKITDIGPETVTSVTPSDDAVHAIGRAVLANERLDAAREQLRSRNVSEDAIDMARELAIEREGMDLADEETLKQTEYEASFKRGELPFERGPEYEAGVPETEPSRVVGDEFLARNRYQPTDRSDVSQAYQDAQARIDEIETRLTEQYGEDAVTAFNPFGANESTPINPSDALELRQAYSDREAIGKTEDVAELSAVWSRLSAEAREGPIQESGVRKILEDYQTQRNRDLAMRGVSPIATADELLTNIYNRGAHDSIKAGTVPPAFPVTLDEALELVKTGEVATSPMHKDISDMVQQSMAIVRDVVGVEPTVGKLPGLQIPTEPAAIAPEPIEGAPGGVTQPIPDYVDDTAPTLKFGTVEKVKQAARLGARANTVRTLDERLQVVEPAPKSYVDIRGKDMSSPQNARTVMRTTRSPLTENLSLVGLDDTGVVRHYETYSSGALDYVEIASKLDQVLGDFADVAGQAGATELVLVHNHPSGDTSASQDDLGFTREVGQRLAARELPVKFERHYIIDHNTVTTITSDGAFEKTNVTPPTSAIPDWTEGNVRAVLPVQVVELVGGDASRQVDVLYRDTSGRAVALVPHGYDEMLNAGTWLEAEAQRLGGQTAILVVSESQETWYNTLVEQANVYTAERAGQKSRPIADVIAIAEAGESWKSAATTGELMQDVPAPRYQLQPAQRVAEGGRPMDEAAVQSDIFGGEELVGSEQTSMFGEDVGKQRQELRSTKITLDELNRLIDERGGEAEPAGEQPLDMFGGVAEEGPQYEAGIEGEPRKPELDEVAAELKSPPGPATQTPESSKQKRQRYTSARNLLDELGDRIGRRPRTTLEEPFKSQVSEILEKVMTPRQVRQYWDNVLKAGTHVKAYDLVVKARDTMERAARNSAIADLNEALKKAYTRTQKTGMRPEYLAKIDAVMADIDMEAMGEKTRQSLQATADYMEAHPENNVPAEVLERVRRLDKTNIRELTSDEIYTIVDVVNEARHFSAMKQQMKGSQRHKTRDEVASEIQTEMQEIKKLPVPRKYTPKGEPPTEGPPLPEAKGATRRLITRNLLEGEPKRSTVSWFLEEMGTRPEVLMEYLSPRLRDLVWEELVVQAHSQQERLRWQFRDALMNHLKTQGLQFETNAFEDWRKQTLELSVPGPEGTRTTAQITRDEAISILGSIKDPTNRKIMTEHGFVRTRATTDVLKIDEESVEQLNQITGEREKSLATFMHEQFNGSMKEALNEAWVDVYGVDVAKVLDYWPRSVDMTRTYTGQDPLERMAAEREASLTSWGHLRKREGAGAPLKIGSAFDTFLNHTEHVARLAAYLAPTSDAHSILGRPEMKRAMIDRVGAVGYNRILESIKAQTVQHAETSDAAVVLRKLMRNVGGSILGLRLTAIFKNPSGLMVSAAYQPNGFTHLAKAVYRLRPAEISRVSALAKKHSPYWRTRYHDFVHQQMGGMIQDRTRSYGKKDITEKGLTPLQESDRFGATIRWMIAELHISESQPELQHGSDEYYEQVAREWERMMYRGENTSHGGDMTGAIYAGKRNAAVGPFVQFTSSVSKIYSLGVRGVLQAEKGNVEAATRSMVGTLGALAWGGMVTLAFFKLRGKDDEEDGHWYVELPKLMVKDFVSFAPFVGPTFSAMLDKAMGGQGFRYPGNITEGMLQDMLQTANAVYGTIDKALTDKLNEEGEKAYLADLIKAFKGIAEFAGQLYGVPTGGGDLIRLIGRLIPDQPNLRDTLRELQSRENVTQENRHILEAIREDDSEAFRNAVENLRKKEKTPTYSDVIAVVNRHYGPLTRYEPGKSERQELTSDMLDLIDAEIMERNELREMARRLATENMDILKPTAPKGKESGWGGWSSPRRKTGWQ